MSFRVEFTEAFSLQSDVAGEVVCLLAWCTGGCDILRDGGRDSEREILFWVLVLLEASDKARKKRCERNSHFRVLLFKLTDSGRS